MDGMTALVLNYKINKYLTTSLFLIDRHKTKFQVVK